VKDAAQNVFLSPEATALARVRVRELSGELRLLGFGTVVRTHRDHQKHPCVEVRGGPGRPLDEREFVYAAPDDLCDESGPWSFWRGASMERLAALDDVSTAVKAAFSMLPGCPGESAGCDPLVEEREMVASVY
jgi:hypothetical protein